MTINTNRIWWIVANVLQEQRFLKNFSFLRSVSWEKIFFHKPTPRRLLKMLEEGVLVSRDGRININHKCWFPVSFKIKNKTVDPQNPPHTTVLRYLTIWWLFSRNGVCLLPFRRRAVGVVMCYKSCYYTRRHWMKLDSSGIDSIFL